MGFPFQCLSPLGADTLFCAARGCSIQTYDLKASTQPLSTWTHPFLKQTANANNTEEVQDGSANGAEKEQPPPPKRRRLASDEAREEKQDAPTNGAKGQKKGKTNRTPPHPGIPFVVLLTGTEDGSHVIAVTGQDKTLWVFEHDGRGSLKEISQRYDLQFQNLNTRVMLT